MARKLPTIEQQRSKYKGFQTRVAGFGVNANDFNEKVKIFLRKQNPSPCEYVFGAWQVAETITRGRCCPKAEVSPCVCAASYTCPDHGTRCSGSHD